MATRTYNNVVRKELSNGEIKEYIYPKKYNVKNKISKRTVMEKIKNIQDYDKLVRVNQFIDNIIEE